MTLPSLPLNMGIVDALIERARAGDCDGAFHGLRECGLDALPALQAAYRVESDPVVRSLIMESIWQHRHPSMIGFLADAIRDPAPEIWKQALDGLVTLASAESIRLLRLAADEEDDRKRRGWIEEAIEQSAESIERH